MQTTRWAAILCALAVTPALATAALAQQAGPEASAGKRPAAQYDASWPVVLKPSVPSAPSGHPPPAWSQQDIEQGRARCAALLDGLDLVAVPADPIREGAPCGTPAPMRLVSIGSSPPVAFSPPATLTCDMIKQLHRWLQHDVQPLARKHLGAPVVGIRVMSSFSCRNAYGRAKTRLSEHGRANALDIGDFLTARGETARVVADWGPVARGTAAKDATKAAAERAEDVKRRAEAVAAARRTKAADATRVAAPSTVDTFQGGTVPIGIPDIAIGSAPSELPTSLGWAPPSRLGGPKDADAGSPALDDGKQAFLHAVHKAACTIFSTVLGPEANRAHRNHFHLDMAKRKSASICR